MYGHRSMDVPWSSLLKPNNERLLQILVAGHKSHRWNLNCFEGTPFESDEPVAQPSVLPVTEAGPEAASSSASSPPPVTLVRRPYKADAEPEEVVQMISSQGGFLAVVPRESSLPIMQLHGNLRSRGQ